MKNISLSQYSKSAVLFIAAIILSYPMLGLGLLFHVDIGAFEEELKLERLVGYDYIQTKKSGGDYHYRVGEYKDYAHAQNATKALRNRGFEESKVVAYLNNNQITLTDAFVHLENENRTAENRFEADDTMPVLELNQRLDKDLVTYKVQVGAFSNPKNLAAFDLPFDVDEIEASDGKFKYQSQHFVSIEDAREAQQLAVGEGIQDAFIVCFRNGKRIAFSQIE